MLGIPPSKGALKGASAGWAQWVGEVGAYGSGFGVLGLGVGVWGLGLTVQGF